MKVAVPVTVPEGWLGSLEVRSRVNFQVEVVARLVKMDLGLESGSSGTGSRGVGSVGLEGNGLLLRIGMFAVGCVGRVALGSWLESNMALTLCSVARLGFSAALLVVIQLSLCLMNDLSMFLASFAFPVLIAPLSSV